MGFILDSLLRRFTKVDIPNQSKEMRKIPCAVLHGKCGTCGHDRKKSCPSGGMVVWTRT